MKKSVIAMLIIISIGSFISSCRKEVSLKEEVFEPSTNNKLKSATTTNYTLIWSDEFGSLDPNKWNIGDHWKYRFRYPDKNNIYGNDWSFIEDDTTGGGDWDSPANVYVHGSTPIVHRNTCVTWDNPANVYVSGGNLVIHSTNDAYNAQDDKWCDFSTGCIYSKDQYHYGYYEISADLPANQAIGAVFSFEAANAINVFETDGWRTNSLPTNIHNVINGDTLDWQDEMPIGYDYTIGFHTFGLYWQPNLVEWYVDHKLVRQMYNCNYIGTNPKNINFSINLPPASIFITTDDIIAATQNTINIPFDDYLINYIRMYDKRPTTALFSTLNDLGTITTLSDFIDWNLNWDVIVPGNFNYDQYKDLFLYSKSLGKARFVSCDGAGNITNIQEINNFGSTWDQIIPGNFGGSNLTDLLLYDSSQGKAKFISIDGSFSSSSTIIGWPTTYKIVTGNFDNSGFDDLLFYNTNLGTADFKRVLSANNSFSNIQPQITGWRKTWNIIPGNYGGSGLTDLLLYDKSTSSGEGLFYSPDGSFNSTSIISGWRNTWKIISGNFNISNSVDELLFYDTNNNGQAYFYTVTSPSGIYQFKSYTDWNPSWDIIVPGQFGGTNNDDLLFYDR